MTAVRRWTATMIASLLATALTAQTTTTEQTRRATEPVTAETDKDLANPNALKLSMQDSLRTAMERNLGISLQSFEFRMAGESLRPRNGLSNWFGSPNLARPKVKEV